MKVIDIKNKEIIAALDEFLWFVKNPIVEKNLRLECEPARRDDFISSKYRDEMIAMGTKHDGFPEAGRYISVKPDRITETRDADPQDLTKIFNKFGECNSNLSQILCVRNNALCSVYPPGGFLGWHNNANASAYNLIFSWSETGDGYFKYVDGHTGDEVVVQDKKGWNCKAGYFGSYSEPWYNLVYHAASTECYRMTISYMFDRNEMSRGIQDEVIEEIMTEF